MTATHSARIAVARRVLADTDRMPADDVQLIADRARLRATVRDLIGLAEELAADADAMGRWRQALEPNPGRTR